MAQCDLVADLKILPVASSMSHRIAAYLEDSARVVAMPCSLVVDRLEEAWYVDRDCHDDGGQEVVGQDLTN